MDPDANLREQRRLLERLRALEAVPITTESETQRLDMLERLADLAEAMDGWLSHGGFLPAAWRAGRKE